MKFMSLSLSMVRVKARARARARAGARARAEKGLKDEGTTLRYRHLSSTQGGLESVFYSYCDWETPTTEKRVCITVSQIYRTT